MLRPKMSPVAPDSIEILTLSSMSSSESLLPPLTSTMVRPAERKTRRAPSA